MLFIIIPVHNRLHYTLRCLICLEKQVFRNYKIIIIDDGSTDGTHEYISTIYPSITILQGDGSLFWSKSLNMGIEYVLKNDIISSDCVFLSINNDIEFDENYLLNLINFYNNHKNALIGSISIDIASKKLLYAGIIHSQISAKQIDKASKLYNSQYQQLTKEGSFIYSDSLPGRGLLISNQVIQKIGLLDSNSFIQHMADIDYSISAYKAGFELMIPTNTFVLENSDATYLLINKKTKITYFLKGFFDFKSPIYIKARFRFALKHGKYKYLYFTFDLLRILFGFIQKKLN